MPPGQEEITLGYYVSLRGTRRAEHDKKVCDWGGGGGGMNAEHDLASKETPVCL